MWKTPTCPVVHLQILPQLQPTLQGILSQCLAWKSSTLDEDQVDFEEGVFIYP